VREYFNTEGFNRWNKIYSDSDEVNVVQMQIRNNHQITVDKVLKWVDEDGTAAAGTTFCDAGCGVGTLAIPLAGLGAKVRASDISKSMADEGARRAASIEPNSGEQLKGEVSFETADLESLEGKYDTVTCIDVLIHYPTEKMDEMVGHLCNVADDRFIISFAPYTWFYQALKNLGSMAPGPSKATRAYLHAEADVVAALEKRGFKVARDEMTAGNFYYSRLLEAKRI
ncbi:magnesium-protoporphyrin IX methyltransferase, partial [Baffinella frigidus]